MGIIGLIKDLLIIYVTIRLMLVFIFGLPFNAHVFVFVFILFLSAVIFMLQRMGIIPKLK